MDLSTWQAKAKVVMDERIIFEKEYLARLLQLDKEVAQYPRLKYALLFHQNIRGDPMTFHDKPYLISIYKDKAKRITMQSSVQTGKSEFLIISAFSYAEQGLQVMYVLPQEDIRNTFVANRIDTLIKRVPYYKKMIQDAAGVATNRGLKHFGKGTIFFVYSGSTTAFIEKPIDCIVSDEVDRFNLANYEKADDRMTASPHKIKYEASNPSVDNYGVNRSYRESDQRSLFVKCQSCSQWQKMDWFKNVVMQTDDEKYMLLDREWDRSMERDIHIFCIKCQKPLDRFTKQSVWVPKHPSIQDHHGYHIHQMMSVYVKIYEMWTKFQKGLEDDVAMQVFYNSILGDTYAAEGAKLNAVTLNKCKRNYLMPISGTACIMGIDVGKRLHVVVREPQADGTTRLLFAGTVHEFEDIDELMSRYNVRCFVIDSMPETRKAKDLVDKYRGKGYMCRYTSGLTELNVNNDSRIVSADRTMLMDRVNRGFHQEQSLLPANAQSLDGGDYYALMMCPTRIFDASRNTYVWVGDPDHYFHAEVYCYCAMKSVGDFKVTGLNLDKRQYEPGNVEKAEDMTTPGMSSSMAEYYKAMWAEMTEVSKSR
jgi:uncharacterized protein with PIN domain